MFWQMQDRYWAEMDAGLQDGTIMRRFTAAVVQFAPCPGKTEENLAVICRYMEEAC